MNLRMGVAVVAGETAARRKRNDLMPPEHIMPSPQKRAAQNRKLLGASLNGDAEGVRKALAEGAHIAARNKNGRTALMMAADGQGLDEQMVILHETVEARLGETAEVLLAAAKEFYAGDPAGFVAYVKATDNAGWDAHGIAEHWGHRSVMEQIDAALMQ